MNRRKYFYDPRLEKDEDGAYSVTIWKWTGRKNEFVETLRHSDPLHLLNIVNITVRHLNK